MAALKQITHQDLKNKLKGGSQKFFFRKLNGELRIAIGTLDLNRIPSQNHPKGMPGPGRVTCYYDLEKGLWRSVSVTQEIWTEE